MNSQRTARESYDTMEGEYVGKDPRYDDPTQAVGEMLEDASRFIAENPKKTAVIATAATAAAVAAAVTVAVATAAFLVADELGKLLRRESEDQ